MAERNGEQVVVEFPTFCPKMVAAIGLDKLDKASCSRSIGIFMQRKMCVDKIAKFRRYDGIEIRRKCMRWVKDAIEAVMVIGSMDVRECSSDRQEDIWEPLVAIAMVAGGNWEVRIREAAKQFSGGANTGATESISHQLLSAIRDYFVLNGDKVETTAMIGYLNVLGDFSDSNRGRGISSSFLAQQLRPYNITSHNIRKGEQIFKGYAAGDFKEAFATYFATLAAESAVSKRYTATEPGIIDQSSLFAPATEAKCSVSENMFPFHVHAGCSGVADLKPATEEEDLI